MRIREKISIDRKGLIENGAITIVAFGDSVTHGFDLDYGEVYHERLRKKIVSLGSYAPINVINAGISGTCAKDSVDRMQSQVFSHNPDLVIVAFGLNDVNCELDIYLNALRDIFSECQKRDVEVVFLTPNMTCTYLSDEAPKEYIETAKRLARYQTEGRMDLYIYSAKELALSMGIKVADCYSEWKELSKTRDVTVLLSNRINHPIPEMHELFAEKIFEQIFDTEIEVKNKNESTIYEK